MIKKNSDFTSYCAFRSAGFTAGTRPFRFIYHVSWGYPAKKDYVEWLEDYKKEIKDEIKTVEKEISRVEKETVNSSLIDEEILFKFSNNDYVDIDDYVMVTSL